MRYGATSRAAGALARVTLVPAAAQQSRTFDVASIRQNVSGDPRNGGATQTIGTRPGRLFTATNVTLQSLIRWACSPLFGRIIPSGHAETCGAIAAGAAGRHAVLQLRDDVGPRQLRARELQTTVTDRTGLSGEFDYVLTYAGMQPVAGGAVDVPILFVAIEEQFGLKLERQRGDVEVLVIDAVHELIEN